MLEMKVLNKEKDHIKNFDTDYLEREKLLQGSIVSAALPVRAQAAEALLYNYYSLLKY